MKDRSDDPSHHKQTLLPRSYISLPYPDLVSGYVNRGNYILFSRFSHFVYCIKQPLMVDSLSYCSFQPVPHDWCHKGRGMYYPICDMMLIGKSSPCGGSGCPLSLSEWSFIISLTSYNRVLSVSLNKTFPSFLPLNSILFKPCLFRSAI